MLLILQSEYDLHQQVLELLVLERKKILIDTDSWLYCNVLDQIKFDRYSIKLDPYNYLDGVDLPPKVIETI